MKELVTEKRLEKCAFSLSAPLESQFEVNEGPLMGKDGRNAANNRDK